MIKALRYEKLNGKIDNNLLFYDDLNLLTGKNGSGKTTIIKTIWYILSGHLDNLLKEISFQSITLTTSSYEFTIALNKINTANISFYKDGKLEFEEKEIPNEVLIDTRRIKKYDEFNNIIKNLLIESDEKSIFFPTFRRLEGGFSTDESESDIGYRRRSSMLLEALDDLAASLSVRNHRFIASISTVDIINLLRRVYSENSAITNMLHTKLSEYIVSKISGKTKFDDPNELLLDIKKQVDTISDRRIELTKPLEILKDVILQTFNHKGIRLSRDIYFGGETEELMSEKLSAGEKQMLSFLAYNAFSNRNSIFIDEPEISLHIDWQRTLFPILLSQNANNQFIITTHSPFIYSKYHDKEILIGNDKGE